MNDETKNSRSDGQNTESSKVKPFPKGRKAAPKNDFEALQAITEADSDSLQSYYNVVHTGHGAGVYFHEAATAKDGAPYMKPPVRLSDPFEIIGRGQSSDEREYRLLSFRRPNSREQKLLAMPLEIVGRPDCWAFLRANGIGVNQNGASIAHLANYLQWEGNQTEYRFSKRGGWCDDSFTAYILPNGEIIGTPETPVFYIGDLSRKRAYEAAGSLEEWQQQIARYAAGNSRLLLALGTGFAAPLLAVIKQENGGFHFFGQSSIGKSISGMAALSLVGNPEELRVQWNGTGLSFDNTAAANHDGMMMLDEMGQADGKTLDAASYAVFNGAKKGQGAKDGGNREHITWRVLALSTGEYAPEYFMKKYGLDWQAGQAVRLPSVPADAGKGFGTFEQLHGFAKPELLAAHLEQAVKRCHGTAMRAYVGRLSEEMKQNPNGLKGRLNSLYQQFLDLLPPDLASQPVRAAKRFALVAAALELAAKWQITGLAQGEGMAGVKICFDAWLDYAGRENKEETDILKAARDFMMEHGYTERFVTDPKKSDGSINYAGDVVEAKRNHAGYRLTAKNSNEGWQDAVWYITDKVFEEEICKGKDIKLVCKVLADAAWLQTDGRNNKRKVPNVLVGENLLPSRIRMYCLRGLQPPEKYENGAGD